MDIGTRFSPTDVGSKHVRLHLIGPSLFEQTQVGPTHNGVKLGATCASFEANGPTEHDLDS